MTSEAFVYTQQLWLLYSQKLVVLERLLELCELQSQSDLHAEADLIAGWLARKQPLMDELSTIQQQLSVYAQDDPEARQWYSPCERNQCRQMADGSQALLQKILMLEQQTIDSLTQHRDAVACQLQDGRDCMLIRNLYQSDPNSHDGSLDLGSI